MKTITNKKVSYVSKEPNKDFTGVVDKINDTDYFKLIEDCCNKPSTPQSGFTYEDIKSIDKVKQAISKEKEGKVKFEDADFTFIQSQVAIHKWPIADIQFADFMDYIKNMK